MTVAVAAPPKVGPQKVRLFLGTARKDNWWVPSLLTFLGFSAFIVYATWAGLQADHYWYPPDPARASLLAPMDAPEIFGVTRFSWFGPPPAWLVSMFSMIPFVTFTPALLILWAPGGFRFTCYYYRGAYYKAFWADPVACAVGEPRHSYLGETFLLIFQNIHRYFMYFALLFILLLSYDVWEAMWWRGADGATHFEIHLATLIMAGNVVLISLYTLGCHSFRHLIGGRKDSLAASSAMGRACYDGCSKLNSRHMLWAWCSLFSVGLTDFYVRLLAYGVFTDHRIF